MYSLAALCVVLALVAATAAGCGGSGGSMNKKPASGASTTSGGTSTGESGGGGWARRFRDRAHRRRARRAGCTHYARRSRPSRRELRDRELLVEIEAARAGYRQVYGARKTWLELRRRRGRRRARSSARVMRQHGIEGKLPIPDETAVERARDLLQRDFAATAPNEKWLCAPKGAGFLYVRRELQRDIHPLVISWGYEGDDPTFLSRHERQGTRDPSAYLTVPTAIEWQREHDWDAVRAECHTLARRARNELGLEPLTPDSTDFYGQMVSLRLPGDAPEDLQRRLYDEHRVEIPVVELDGSRLIRPSFQGYNDASDLERLAAALEDLH